MAEILINEDDRRAQFTATGGEGSITYDFPIFASSELLVELQSVAGAAKTTLVEVTDYTVNNVGEEDGGTITLVVAATLNEVYTLTGALPESRTTDFQQAGQFRASTVNREFDRMAIMIQQLRRDMDRAARMASEDTGTEASMILPLLAARLGKLVGWDETTGDFEPTAVTVAQINQVIQGAIANASDQMADGGESAPGLPFLSDTDTGFFRPTANQLAMSIGGVRALLLASTILQFDTAGANDAHLKLQSEVDSGTPAQIDFAGHSGAAAERTYLRILASITDNTNASEDAKLIVQGMVAGALTTFLEANPAAGFTFTTTANDGIKVVSSVAGIVGATMTLHHNSPSPASGDTVGSYRSEAENDADEVWRAFQMDTVIEDKTDGTEDARTDFWIMTGGTFTRQFTLQDGARFGSTAINFQGDGTVNTKGLFVRDRILAGWELITETDIAAAAAVTFSGLKDIDSIADAFEAFVLLIDGAEPATNDDELRIRLAVGASSIDTGSNYHWNWLGQIAGGAAVARGASSATAMTLCDTNSGDAVGNVAGEGLSAVIYFLGVNQASKTRIVGEATYIRANTAVMNSGHFMGIHNNTADELDDIELTWSSAGNFAAVGRMSLYGLRRVKA